MSALSQLYGSTSATVTSVGAPSFLSGNPGLAVTNINPYISSIIVTFDKQVVKGSTGNITIRQDSATGTAIATYSVSSSPYVSVSGADVTIDLKSSLIDLPANKNVYVVFDANSFKDALGLTGISSLTTYYFTTSTTKRKLYGWGTNTTGQLGYGFPVTGTYPYVSEISSELWSEVSRGAGFSLGVKNDGTLWAWGKGTDLQLGVNIVQSYSSPVQVPGTNWNFCSATNGFSLATKTDGTLWAWGQNNRGQLGQTSRMYQFSPTQIPGTNWRTNNITGSIGSSFATKTDNTLWSWGYNLSGQLALNDRAYRSSPTQIPGTNWSSVNSVGSHSVAFKTDGTLWTWGNNAQGRLGQNTTTYYSSPVQIPGTNWSAASTGFQNSFGIKSDGTLWAWGNGSFGEMGINVTTSRSSPTQIPGTNWNSITTSTNSGLATKTDGTLWAWGASNLLGQNGTTSYSSPVQIPGTNWSFNDIQAGYSDFALAFQTFT